MAKRVLLPDPCPSCKAVELDDKMFSWHGTTSDGRPAGDVQFWIECAACGEDPIPHFGRIYPSTATFAEVRGDRVFNCHCGAEPIHRLQWKKMQEQGARYETNW